VVDGGALLQVVLDAQIPQKRCSQFGKVGIAPTTRLVELQGHIGDEVTLVEHQDAIGQRYGLIDIVGDQQHRRLMARAELADQALHLQPGECVERSERLVEQEKVRFSDQRPCKRGSLGLASRKGRWPDIAKSPQPYFSEGSESPRAGVGPFKAEGHIAPDTAPRQQTWLLEDHGPMTCHRERPLDTVIESGSRSEQCALASPALPQENHKLTFRDLEIEIAKNHPRTERSTDTLQTHGRLRRPRAGKALQAALGSSFGLDDRCCHVFRPR